MMIFIKFFVIKIRINFYSISKLDIFLFYNSMVINIIVIIIIINDYCNF